MDPTQINSNASFLDSERYTEAETEEIRERQLNKARAEHRLKVRKAIGGLLRIHGYPLENPEKDKPPFPLMFAQELEAKCFQISYQTLDDGYKTRIENIVRNV